MKIKTILLISIIFLINNSVFSVELPNSEQVKKEQIASEKLKEYFDKDKTAPYKLLILEDYLASRIWIESEKHNTLLKDLLKAKYDYKDTPTSDNFIYATKAIDLYKGIKDNIIFERVEKSKKIKLQRIDISNDLIEKLDKRIFNGILMCNIVVEQIQKSEDK